MNKMIINEKIIPPVLSNRVNSQFNFFLFTDKFISLLMRDGKKVKAAKLFFNMLLFLKKKVHNT